MATIKTEFSTIEVLEYVALDRDGCSRRERVTMSDRTSYIGYRHATGPDDVSGPAPGYDIRCGWCFLGTPHTEAAHLAKCSAKSKENKS